MHRYNTRSTTTAQVGIVNCLVLLLLSTLLIATLLDLKPALAHVFLFDKNALLLAIANQLKTELELISYNLNHSDNNLALKHLADA
jgi:Na+-transporting NADH:ubiquinone oxidoreductase subunit NqrC